ncbi:hypothetical protein, unlikely [Trypanosoma brucei gambiense DAL972]|uniref:Uncharacterized protein n=1 Tax=Trypanosoma brucei gambiense (strain MHOM/CI/86/DAL972) TaxID=679716 RepID=C9ZYE9_TRYB9|nr:hypothetical protein, unlikely [Trypanosoma brucei gambiense DAL972]CBH14448.1 hypothetical protein, unlikely [Trypanosoma brucei gambiense DAL972]|eukprot:XP_011776714.1 hypothetical protein, unlikely [Trypanosoma brucei gambiense DAL972]
MLRIGGDGGKNKGEQKSNLSVEGEQRRSSVAVPNQHIPLVTILLSAQQTEETKREEDVPTGTGSQMLTKSVTNDRKWLCRERDGEGKVYVPSRWLQHDQRV